MRLTAISAAAILLAAPALAGVPAMGDIPNEQAKEYADCMTLARRVPAQALESAHAWAGKGGGTPAGHCAAVALIGLGRYQEAATSMEKLAGSEVNKRKDLAAGLYGQAAQAWVLANDSARAIKDQTAAIELAPGDPDLLIDRGLALASIAKYWEAIDDFNQAHDIAGDRADILVFRAAAYRKLRSLDLARDDIEQAIKLQPRNPDAYLERSIIRQLGNDMAGAKEDWQRTVSFGPGTPAAETAAANLKQLEQPAPAAPPAQPIQPNLPLPPAKPQP